jgi:hypothetical protein
LHEVAKISDVFLNPQLFDFLTGTRGATAGGKRRATQKKPAKRLAFFVCCYTCLNLFPKEEEHQEQNRLREGLFD